MQGAGDEAAVGQRVGAAEEGHRRRGDAQRDGAGARHFQTVAEQAEAGDVGDRVHERLGAEHRVGAVQQRGQASISA